MRIRYIGSNSPVVLPLEGLTRRTGTYYSGPEELELATGDVVDVADVVAFGTGPYTDPTDDELTHPGYGGLLDQPSLWEAVDTAPVPAGAPVLPTGDLEVARLTEVN